MWCLDLNSVVSQSSLILCNSGVINLLNKIELLITLKCINLISEYPQFSRWKKYPIISFKCWDNLNLIKSELLCPVTDFYIFGGPGGEDWGKGLDVFFLLCCLPFILGSVSICNRTSFPEHPRFPKAPFPLEDIPSCSLTNSWPISYASEKLVFVSRITRGNEFLMYDNSQRTFFVI